MAGEHYLEELRQIAEANGGKLLSTEWGGARIKYRFAFASGNEFQISANNLKTRGWPKDKDDERQQRLQHAHAHAERHGGKCLSTKYGNGTELHFICSCTHQWFARYEAVLRGSWCAVCSGNAVIPQRALALLKNHAEQRGGKCLSTKWKGTLSRYEFECGDCGHVWHTTWGIVKQGSWCPKCGELYIREHWARDVFECLFEAKFPRTTKVTAWLHYGKGRYYILDGYNDSLKIAFEYHGEQHHKMVKHFGRTLENQQHVDKAKRDICADNGVTLIEIWAKSGKETLNDLVSEVCSILESSGVLIERARLLNLKIRSAPSRMLQRLHREASARDGECLSSLWTGARAKYSFRCSCGYEWETTANSIFANNSWCPECGRQKRNATAAATIKRKTPDRQKSKELLNAISHLANQNNASLLSTKWTGRMSKYHFVLADGREFEICANNLLTRGWPKNPDRYFKLVDTLTKKQAPEVRP